MAYQVPSMRNNAHMCMHVWARLIVTMHQQACHGSFTHARVFAHMLSFLGDAAALRALKTWETRMLRELAHEEQR